MNGQKEDHQGYHINGGIGSMRKKGTSLDVSGGWEQLQQLPVN